ncbi:MAG TPA: efflux RND transporter permease subunit, partial [Candidatus Cybelea sp.]|nr:efflux RND transporter permease subunit [Candidatus Cybelea sp.]
NEIERLAIEPIEEQLRGLPEISRVSSSAQNGIAEIVVEFRFGSDLGTNRANVQSAVDSARANMPLDLVAPIVSDQSPTQAPILEEAISSALLSSAQLSEVVTTQIVPTLRATAGVGVVRDSGAVTRQLVVRPQLGALDALGGTALDVFRAVAAGNDLLPGGLLRSSVRQSTIGIDASIGSAEQIARLPVTIPGSATVRVRDVAQTSDTHADRAVIARADGDEATLLYVAAAPGADSLATIAATRRAFLSLGQRYPEIRFAELRTDRASTNAAIGGVLQTLGEGIVLTVLVMLVFLHAWRNATIAAISIPTSLCAAFVAMWALGFTLNVLSLMGLSLTIGILVDDSIVIIEAIARAAARGLRGDDAALAGRSEIGGAAFAITFVDVAVFLPIGMMNGIVGEFMREFALVIVFATAFSLLVSFTLTPLLTARWALARHETPLGGLSFANLFESLRARARRLPWTLRGALLLRAFAAWHAAINGFNWWERNVCRVYAERWLPAMLNRPRIVVTIAAVACAGSLAPLLAWAIPAEFSPPAARGALNFDLTMPPGTPIERTDAAVTRIALALLDDPAVRHVESSAGRSFDGTTDVFATNVAAFSVVLQDQTSSGAAVERRVRSLAALAPSGTIAGAGKGMGGVPAVSYDVGGDPAQLDAAAQRIASLARENPSAADVRTSDLGLQPSLKIAVDMEKARLLSVSPDDVAQTARIASGGALATKARLAPGLVDVVVRAGAAESGDIDAIERFPVRSATGELVPLADLIQTRTTSEPAIVRRENGERVVTVSANAAGDAPISLVSSPIARALRDPAFLPPGTRVEPRGDIAQFLATVSRILGSLGLSIIAVYFALAVLYRSYALPLVVMLTVPLASIGAFGSLFIFRAPLNLYSMLGIVMLVGLVAKNGILLVDYAERAVRNGSVATVAMIDAARARFRPIVMTTVAMIAGMLPLALGHTAGAEYRRALGIVVIGGLSTSLLLTLAIVPVAYVWYRTRRSRPVVARLASAPYSV